VAQERRRWPSDVARFDAADPEAVVAAAFACAWCLRRPAIVVLRMIGDEFIAACHCVLCSPPTEVALSRSQALRVIVAPPADLAVRMHAAEA
jgi:hypothetical protein